MLMEITACVHDGWLIIDDYKHVSQEFIYYHFLAERQGLVSVMVVFSIILKQIL